MQMTSFSFLLYFLPIMLCGYFLLLSSRKWQNIWLVLCGVAFYAFGGVAYAAVLLGLAAANYFLGRAGQRERDSGKTGKRFVAIACAVNLFPLVFFKYLHPAVDAIAGLFGATVPEFPAAPLGISFLALQGISYAIDLYRGTVPWDSNFFNSALYFTFFPALPAGPVIRYHDIAKQIPERTISLSNVVKGLPRFIVGLAKVVLLAAPVMAVAEIIFSQSNLSGIYTSVPASLAWLGLLASLIGIYHYYSGYSDMAIGLGKMLGFRIPENFDHPHLASSVTAFWKRCFSSLARWFDEYVYQPLDKSRGHANNDRMVLHTLIMWLLVGIWIGPGVPNIVLGFCCFLFIVVERIIEIDVSSKGGVIRHCTVLLFMLIVGLSLQTDTLYQFALYASNLLGMRGAGFSSEFALFLLGDYWLVLLLGVICSFPIGTGLRRYAKQRGGAVSVVYSLGHVAAVFALAALIVISISGSSYDPSRFVWHYLWS